MPRMVGRWTRRPRATRGADQESTDVEKGRKHVRACKWLSVCRSQTSREARERPRGSGSKGQLPSIWVS